MPRVDIDDFEDYEEELSLESAQKKVMSKVKASIRRDYSKDDRKVGKIIRGGKEAILDEKDEE